MAAVDDEGGEAATAWPEVTLRQGSYVAAKGLGPDGPPPLWHGAGLYLADGAPDPLLARFMGSDRPLPPGVRSTATTLPEAIFCGPMRNHFGHFLAESTGRLWAATELRPDVPLVYFSGQNRDRRAGPTAKAFLRQVGLPNPVIVVDRLVQVERLHLAPTLNDPLFGLSAQPLFQHWLEGRLRSGRREAAEEGLDLYISRSRLSDNAGRYLGEAALEAGLMAQGYRVIHPETMSLGLQIAAYRAARRIVLAEGSPLHLLALLDVPGQQVATIMRRPRLIHNMPATMASLRRARHVLIERVAESWKTEDRGAPWFRALSRLDLEAVWRDLEAAGFIDRAAEMPVPDAAAVERERRLRLAGRAARAAT